MVGARAHKDCPSAEGCAPFVFYFPLFYSALAHYFKSSPFAPSVITWLENKALLILSNLQSPIDNKFIVPTHSSLDLRAQPLAAVACEGSHKPRIPSGCAMPTDGIAARVRSGPNLEASCWIPCGHNDAHGLSGTRCWLKGERERPSYDAFSNVRSCAGGLSDELCLSA